MVTSPRLGGPVSRNGRAGWVELCQHDDYTQKAIGKNVSLPNLEFITWKSRPLIWLEKGSGCVGRQEGQGKRAHNRLSLDVDMVIVMIIMILSFSISLSMTMTPFTYTPPGRRG